MTGQIGWGIAGTGRVAEGFAVGVRAVSGARLVAVASRTRSRADEFAARHGAVRVHPDFAALAADPDVDVVYVATPNDRHADDALTCIAAGKAVLCEKPFTIDATEARRVVDAARARGTFCMEGMWMRFIPAVRRAVELVETGAIGDVRAVYADFSHPVEITPQSRLFDPARGGGALLDLGVYTLSLAHMFLGRPESIDGHLAIGATGVDEHASLALGYPSGAIATLTSSLRSRGPNVALIVGSEGRITLPGPICAPDRLVIERMSDASELPGRPDGQLMRLVRSHWVLERTARTAKRTLERALRRNSRVERHRLMANGYEYEVAEVVRCLREGASESPMMPLDISVATMELIDRVRGEHQLP
jgi:predicted dehydrogenase